MSARTKYITSYRYRGLPFGLREDLEAVLGREELVERYAGNVESELHRRGEHRLAFDYLAELETEGARYCS